MTSIPPSNADLVTKWAFLESSIDPIMTKWDPSSIPYAKYMGFYTVVFDYCEGSFDVIGADISCSRHKLGCADLYDRLVRYFTKHVQGVQDQFGSLRDEPFLRYYAKEWDRYTVGANYVNRLFTYLNRRWVKPKRAQNRKIRVYPVSTLALVQWKSTFFQNMQQNVADAVLSLIKQERDGTMIDQDLVKKVIDSFVSLGVNEPDLNKTSLDFYKEYFEDRFIAATERYYKQESESFFAQGNSVVEYLEVAERRLREEEYRVMRYLQPRTREPLVNKCQHIFNRERMNALR